MRGMTRNAGKRPTMKDVASQAGVSVQTVSAVVNGKPGITEETSVRVRRVIEQLGYRPDFTARSLRSGRRRTLALFVSNVANSVLGVMASAAEDCAHSTGYNLVLYNTHDDPEREESYLNTAAQGSVDGVLFVAASQPLRGYELLDAAGIPSVTVDRIPEGYDGPQIGLDNVKAGRLAGEHLLSLGHRRLAHLASPSYGLRLARERQSGFLEAAQAGSAEVWIEPSDYWGCQPGYHAMRRLLGRSAPPTAVFAASDLLAFGAMHAIREAGRRIPDDISVVGLDDIEVSAFHDPPLTTVRQSLAEMATLGVRMLVDILDGREPTHPHVVLEPELIVRQSTGPHLATGD